MALSKDAQQLYPKLASAPGIDAFWLVGGTALALQIAHRLSEDFDFAATERRLPRKKIEGILDHLSRQGVSITPVENLELEQELEDSGLDPLDAQQDFLADNVKLTFFVVDAPALLDQATPVWRHGLRLAPPSSLFTMKRLLLTKRFKTRDLFDLYCLIKTQGYSVADIEKSIKTHHRHYPISIVRRRLLEEEPPLADPGFVSLAHEGSTTGMEQMRAFFQQEIARLEANEAKETLRRRNNRGPSLGR